MHSTKAQILRSLWLLPFAVMLAISAANAQTPILCGQTITNSISAAAEIDQYTFNGSVGQTVALGFVGNGNCFSDGQNAVLDLYNPGGQKITSLSHCDVRSTNLTLAASGTYTILVHDDDYAQTTTYALSVQSFTGGGCNTTAISCGQTISTNISRQTETDAYIYIGNAGQTVALGFVGNGNCFSDGQNAVLDLYNPGGQKITSLSHCDVRSTNLTLAVSGTYTILVHDDDYAQTTTYALSVQSFTGGGCNTTAISCGQTISTNISRQTETDTYTYIGNTGQTVALSFVGNGNCFSDGQNAVLDLYNPGGQKITSLSHCDVRSTNLTLAASGTYTILVHDDDYAQTTTYALSVQSFTGGGCNTTAISCGQTISTNISRQTETDAYTYIGNAGQTVALGFVGNGNCFSDGQNAVLDLYNPGGQKVTSLSHCDVRSTNLTLAVSGTYTILVHDDDYTQTTTYALSVQSFTGGGCASVPIVSGQAINTNLSRKAEIDAFGLGVNPGTLILSFVGNGNCFSDGQNAVLDLYNPGGQKITSLSHCGVRSTNLTLAASGTYTILVHDDDYEQTSSYSFTATYIGPCNYSITPTSVSVDSGATNGTVSVTVGTGCDWAATTNASWLRITSGSSGSGNGTVSYAVDANTSTNARAGEMTIAGWIFRVSQAGAVALVGNDVGAPCIAGSFSYSDNVYSVSGSGEDIADTADDFYFVHQPLTGDGQIVARVASLVATDAIAEAGIMIRETLNTGAKHAFLRVDTKTSAAFRRRLANDASSVENTYSPTNRPWLRLMRMGNTFVAHCSPNGTDWEYLWFTTLSISNQVQAGLAVTAHHNCFLATAQFDNVSVGSLTPLPGPRSLSLHLGGEPMTPAEWQRLGGFKLLVGGAAGDYHRIQATTTVELPFANWSTLGTVTNTYGVLPILDPSATTNHMKYYRAERIGP